ncbi:hypothetical protein ACHAXT_006023 [Thalassiosira profunda]
MASTDPAATSPSETPEWLKPSAGQSASTGAATDEESFGATASAPVDSLKGTEEAAPAPRRRCTRAILGILELVLLAAFVYAAIVQSDDPDKLRWHLYYAFQAALPALFLAYFFCGRARLLGKLIVALAAATSVWSIVYIVLVSLDLQKLLAEEEPDADAKEEYIYELAGVSLGFLSSLYHGIFAICCVRKEKEGMA